MSLLNFHQLAAMRGDGLRPELRALFERSSRGDACEVSVRPDGMLQAGPDPSAPRSTIPLSLFNDGDRREESPA